MSLTAALHTGTSGIKVAQDSIANAGHNIGNVNTPGYVKTSLTQESVVLGNAGYGARVTGISTDVSSELLRSMRNQASLVSSASSINEFLDQAQKLFGNPNSENSLPKLVDGFFSNLKTLSDNPELTSLRLGSVESAKALAAKISNIASGISQLRLDSDSKIANSVNQANDYLKELHSINQKLFEYPKGTFEYADVINKRDIALKNLSSILDIKVLVDQTGRANITTGNGIQLLDNNRYELSYSPASSIDVFNNDLPLDSISVMALDRDGNKVESSKSYLTTTGQSSTISTILNGGSLSGLLNVRDKELPDILKQLDNLAKSVKDNLNAIHNSSVSYPPPSSLTGQKQVSLSDSFGFSGSVMLAVLDANGKPVASPYINDGNYKPLTLDLSKLDSGSGAGKPDLATIINEINNYYGPPQNIVSAGNIRNISLAAISDSIADDGTFTFDLDIDNTSSLDSTIEVTGISLVDPVDNSVLPNSPTLPSAYTSNAGEKARTGLPITVDFSGDDNRSSYKVRLNVKITDSNGNVTNSEIEYLVSDNVTDIKNKRYSPTSLVSGDGSFIGAPSSARFLEAKLVDANGNKITDPTTPGYLKIESSNPNYYIAMNEMDSKETGLSNTPTASITNFGFSHFFGLNNFFNDTANSANSAARTLQIREDIAKNPNLLGLAELTLSNKTSASTGPVYTYEISAGNSKSVTKMAELDQKSVSFKPAGSMSKFSGTISAYTGNIVSIASGKAVNASKVYDLEKLGQDGLDSMFQDQYGIDTDEELAKIIEFGNNFKASAQIISLSKELLDSLFNVF